MLKVFLLVVLEVYFYHDLIFRNKKLLFELSACVLFSYDPLYYFYSAIYSPNRWCLVIHLYSQQMVMG